MVSSRLSSRAAPPGPEAPAPEPPEVIVGPRLGPLRAAPPRRAALAELAKVVTGVLVVGLPVAGK